MKSYIKLLIISLCTFLFFESNAQNSTLISGFVSGADGEFVVVELSDGDETILLFSDLTGEVYSEVDISDWNSESLTVTTINCYGLLETGYLDWILDSDGNIVFLFFEIFYCDDLDIFGCTDPVALNYDPLATADDGSCEYPESAPNDLCANASELIEGITLVDNTNAFLNEGMDGDCWGFGSGEAEQTSVWYSFTTPVEPVSVVLESMNDGTSTLTDTQFGLYLECGADMVECDGNSGDGLYAKFDFTCGYLEPNTTYILQIDGWNADSGTCHLLFEMNTCEIPEGCTDCYASNYDPEAVIDDGSCEYEEFICDDGTYVTLFFVAGTFAEEMSIYVNGVEPDWFPCNVDAFISGYTYSAQLCLEDGCQVIEMYDSFGDGWNGNEIEFIVGEESFMIGLDEGYYGVELLPINVDSCEDVVGCTDPNACNFNPDATIEDYTCTYPGCTDETALNYNYWAGCDDGSCVFPTDCEDGEIMLSLSAYNYTGVGEISIANEEGEEVYFNDDFSFFQIFDYVCVDSLGCFTVSMFSDGIDSLGFADMGFWLYEGTELVAYNYSYEENFLSVEFSLDGSCGEIMGCTDPDACNYDELADVENWSCTYPGCTDPEALNYELWAGCDDSSCEYPCGEDEVTAQMYVCTFANGDLVELEIIDDDGNIVFSQSGFPNNTIEYIDLCLDPEMCYTVNMSNVSETGWYSGYFWINVDGVQVTTESLDPDLEYESYVFAIDGSCGPISGCTDPNACNYNEEAEIEDWSCTYPGCMDEEALNYYPWAGCEDNSLCEYLPECGDGQILVNINAYAYYEDSELSIYNESGEVVYYNGDFSLWQVTDFICLDEEGCYTIELSSGLSSDSLYSEFGYWISSFGETIAQNWGWDSDGYLNDVFSLDGSCSEVYGCTDDWACNFNPDATINDWTCTYPGCMDEEALNYNPYAGCHDEDLCEYPFGCEDGQSLFVIEAENFAPDAVIEIISDSGELVYIGSLSSGYTLYEELCLDDGYCYTVLMTVGGSEDQYYDYGFWVYNDGEWVAFAYGGPGNSVIEAVVSLDGECEPVYGCTDPDALNYDEEATIDDGSCIYEEIDCTSLFEIYEIIIADETIIIINSSSGDDLNFFWDFGDGNTSTDQFPIHVYEEEGTYTVCLTVYNDDESCSDTFCMDITYDSGEFLSPGNEGGSSASEDDGFTINIMSEEDATTIGVDEESALESMLSLFPNPTTEFITIQIDSAEIRNWNLSIYDQLGRLLVQSTINNNSEIIDVNDLPSGTYLLSLTHGEKHMVKRFEVIR